MKSRGYTLVALMIGLTIMAILIAAVLPLASTEAQRDKEDELIFRGLQYAEGIRTFRRRYSRYPNTLKEMYEIRPRTLRKLWKDPITNSDKWGLITLTTGAPLTGTASPAPPGGSAGFVPTPVPSPAPTPGFGAPPGQGQPVGPITGVYSLSKKKAFRLFDGRDTYNQWQFTEQTLLNQGPPVSPGPPGPGVVH
ncbi:MAG TPA: type II secretion system protein [Thermoanaerobaculia bacterium]|nr:type II secretion system protein [Thermoanaerobaculia bacterium]